jgi:transcriptional regulator with XRE-family HTH domain
LFGTKPKQMAKKVVKAKKELDPRILEIAEKLEKLRIEKGYTSYENFAIEHGISRMQYWRMEKGSNFTFASFLKILDAHQISLSEFFEGFDKVKNKK